MSIDLPTMNLPMLNEFDGASTIVNMIANTNPLYSAFKIYGDADNQYYLASEMASLVQINNIDNILKNWSPDEYIVAKVENSNKPVKFLTDHGLYRILFMNGTPVGDAFRHFVYVVLDKLKRDHIVRLTDAQEEMRKSFALELHNATNYLNLKINNLEKEVETSWGRIRKSNEYAEEKNSESAGLLQYVSKLEQHIIELEDRLYKSEMQEKLDADSSGVSDVMFNYLRDKVMTYKVYIYLMPCKDDNDYNYDHKLYDLINEPNEYHVMYYRLSTNDTCVRGRIIKKIQFETPNQLNSMRNLLSTYINSGDTYLCELHAILEAYYETINTPAIEAQKNKMDDIKLTLSKLGIDRYV